MSGLFLRLARQAIGQVPNLVHAALPPRYQGEPSVPPVETDGVQPGVSPKNPAASPAVRFESQRLQDTDSAPGPVVDAQGKNNSADIEVRTRQDHAQSIDGERLHPPQPAAHRRQDPAPARRSAEPILEAHDAAEIPADFEAAERHDHRQADHDQPPSAQAAMDKLILAMQPEASAPAPLLAPPASTPETQSLKVEQVPAAPSVAPNEVHVHIGRIEVTALAPPAPPRAKRHADRQPMSLDDYLARRRQRST